MSQFSLVGTVFCKGEKLLCQSNCVSKLDICHFPSQIISLFFSLLHFANMVFIMGSFFLIPYQLLLPGHFQFLHLLIVFNEILDFKGKAELTQIHNFPFTLGTFSFEPFPAEMKPVYFLVHFVQKRMIFLFKERLKGNKSK